MSRYSPLSPKKLRKYHERDETHRTSISGVSIPRCSIDLNPSVRGNGNLTVRKKLGQFLCAFSFTEAQAEFGILMLEREKRLRRRHIPERVGIEVSSV